MANDSIIIKKKKVVAHAAHHGGSWKVAYADFVTAMMAFFMVLWIMGLSDDNKTSIQGYFNDPAGFMKSPPRSKVVVSLPGQLKSAPKPATQSRSEDHGDYAGSDSSAKEDMAYVKNTVKQMTYKVKEKDHIVVSETTQGILIEFLEDVTSVFFETGSANISPLGKEVIKDVVPIIKDTGRFLVLEGHTDKKPYAGKGYTNWELSSERAGAFRRELSKFGIPDSSFKEVRGCADKKLKFPSKPFAPGNRRVALLLPWGKKAAKPNSPKIQNDKTRQAIGPQGDQT